MDREPQYEDEIDLASLLKVLIKRKWLIVGLAILAGGVTAVISLIMTPIYQSKAVLGPVEAKGLGSPTSLLAAQLGVSMPTPGNVAEVVNLIKSNIIREKLIKKMDLIPKFFEEEKLKDKTPEEKVWEALRYMEHALKVNFKQKDNIVEVTMEYKDPVLATKILEELLVELQEHMSAESKRVAEVNRRYLEQTLADTSDPYIKANIYNLIAQQIQQAMLSQAKENFAFKVIDPPKVPDKRIKPKRRLMVTVAFVSGVFIGIFLAFFLEYLPTLKQRLSEEEGSK